MKHQIVAAAAVDGNAVAAPENVDTVRKDRRTLVVVTDVVAYIRAPCHCVPKRTVISIGINIVRHDNRLGFVKLIEINPEGFEQPFRLNMRSRETLARAKFLRQDRLDQIGKRPIRECYAVNLKTELQEIERIPRLGRDVRDPQGRPETTGHHRQRGIGEDHLDQADRSVLHHLRRDIDF